MLEWNACQGLANSRVGNAKEKSAQFTRLLPGTLGVYKPQPVPSLIAGIDEHIVKKADIEARSGVNWWKKCFGSSMPLRRHPTADQHHCAMPDCQSRYGQ